MHQQAHLPCSKYEAMREKGRVSRDPLSISGVCKHRSEQACNLITPHAQLLLDIQEKNHRHDPVELFRLQPSFLYKMTTVVGGNKNFASQVKLKQLKGFADSPSFQINGRYL
ncbi:hypothetical protein AVEN_257365-1 [Araneus ventricosus]|uniref:Uncharacterized protein n=1 Tax=Araneus ventricosus TaxID=182803 RepID=A0A4Y2C9Y5_ARAVE|nr:hypothetical protein AVEN_257365-1 [Araneus ventricosus]